MDKNTQRELLRQKRLQRKKKKRKNLALFVLLAVVAAGVLSGTLYLKDTNGVSINAPVAFQITSGSGVVSLGNALKEQGIIKHPLAFRLIAKLNGYTSIMPGNIKVDPGMSYKEILERAAGKTGVQKFTVPEGFEIRQIADKLESEGLVSKSAFYAALDPSLYDYSFLEGITRTENVLEGYLFPSTYNISEGTDAQMIVDMMLAKFDEVWTDEYEARAKELNMTTDQIVTLASIIERETDSDTERAKVAGVFYNRLNKDMKLQSCATVQYVLKERKANLSIADTKTDSPYNTYLYSGLPIGPIASPGEECLKAALYPEDTTALYFVAGTDGRHIFSDTYEEHVAAKKTAQSKVSVEGE